MQAGISENCYHTVPYCVCLHGKGLTFLLVLGPGCAAAGGVAGGGASLGLQGKIN